MRACALTSILLGGCIYDDGDRCGPGRELQHGLCVCTPGLMELKGECVPNPVAPAGLGDACDGATKTCADPRYSQCQMVDASGGYCTTANCSADSDCEGGFYCEKDEGPSYCRRPPVGQGMACDSDAMCANMEASFCTVGNPMGAACAVRDCTANSCSPGRSCQDLSAFVPGIPKLCLP